jgi:excisionase family DNA binding protein
MSPAALAILINKRAAAALLGISVGLLEKQVRLKRIEPVRIGGRVLFRRSDIEEMAMTPSQRRAMDRQWSGSVQ